MTAELRALPWLSRADNQLFSKNMRPFGFDPWIEESGGWRVRVLQLEQLAKRVKNCLPSEIEDEV